MQTIASATIVCNLCNASALTRQCTFHGNITLHPHSQTNALLSEWCTVKFYTLLQNVTAVGPACVMQNQIAGIHGKHCFLQAASYKATHMHISG